MERRLRIGDRRRTILRILDTTSGPVSAADIYHLALKSKQPISLSTARRTLDLLTVRGLLRRLRTAVRTVQYQKVDVQARESLIDAQSGLSIEFRSDGIEGLLKESLQHLGYRLLDYRLELLGTRTGPEQNITLNEVFADSSPRGLSRRRLPH